MQFGLWQMAAFISSPILLYRLRYTCLYGFRPIRLTQCGIGEGQPLYWAATPSVHPFHQNNSVCSTHQQPTNDVSYNVHHNIWHLVSLSYWSKVKIVGIKFQKLKCPKLECIFTCCCQINISNQGCKIKGLIMTKKLMPLKILTPKKVMRTSSANSEHKHSATEHFSTLNERILLSGCSTTPPAYFNFESIPLLVFLLVLSL